MPCLYCIFVSSLAFFNISFTNKIRDGRLGLSDEEEEDLLLSLLRLDLMGVE